MDAMKATRRLWQTKEMPQKRNLLEFTRHFSQAEFDLLSLGELPQKMEDRWFIFLEGSWLFFHRSWSGACIFQLRLRPDQHGYGVAEAWVNRDTQQYNSGGPANEIELLSMLVSKLLLRNR
jgi:hypothetical protein